MSETKTSPYDQQVSANHKECWPSFHDDAATWWFDNGELCMYADLHHLND